MRTSPPPHEGDLQAPDLARASLLSLTRTKQFPHETLRQYRSRLERLAGKAYHHLPAKDPEPMTISLFASGLLDFRIDQKVRTQAPLTRWEAERIALEFLQIRRGIGAARPRFRRNEPMPPLLADSQPIGQTPWSTATKSQRAPPESVEVDAGDEDIPLFTSRQAPCRPPGRESPSARNTPGRLQLA